jgi:hypothetical protein
VAGAEEELIRVVELWNTGDVEGWIAQAEPDVAFHPDPSFPESGWMRGEVLHRWLREWAGVWQNNRLEPLHPPARHGNAYLFRARWHLAAPESGSEIPLAEFTMVMWLNDAGRLVRFTARFDHEQALALAELPEDEVEAADR